MSEAKIGRLEAEKRSADSVKRETEVAKANFEAKAKLIEMNPFLEGKVASLKEELDQANAAVEAEKKKTVDSEKGIADDRAELAKLREENTALKVEVNKGVEDVVKALGVGYGYSYERLKVAGIELPGHAFEDYCVDLAKTLPESGLKEGNPRLT